MFIVLVSFIVRAAELDAFLIATLEMAHASLKESGCRRIEVLRTETEPTHFVLSESFNARTDGEAHLAADHFKRWQQTIAPMLMEPSHATTYTQLF